MAAGTAEGWTARASGTSEIVQTNPIARVASRGACGTSGPKRAQEAAVTVGLGNGAGRAAGLSGGESGLPSYLSASATPQGPGDIAGSNACDAGPRGAMLG